MDDIFKQNSSKTNLASSSAATKEIKLTDDEEEEPTKSKEPVRASINIQPQIATKQQSFEEKPSVDSKVRY
jgi:hypothetical protein